MREHTRKVRLWGGVVTLAAVVVLLAFLLPSAALGALAAVLAGLALWNLVRLGEPPHPGPVVRDVAAQGADRSVGEGAAAELMPRIPPSLDHEIVLRALMEAVSHIAHPVAAHLWFADEPSATVRLVAAVGPMTPSSQPLSLERDEIIGAACLQRTTQLQPLARLHTPSGERTVWRFALPLVAGAAVGAAAIDFESDDAPAGGALPRATAPLRGSLTGALALHIARAELDTARTLIGVARDLSRILDPQEVLTTALARAMELCDAATGSIMLLDPATGQLVISLAQGLPTDVVRETSLAEGEGIAGWVLASGQPLLIEDLPARTPAARRHGIRSAVSVPISDDDGILGVLNVGSRSFPSRFTESHLAAVEMLGKQTATALRNARAVAESREIYFDTLKALSLALETKDPYARGGTERVLEYAAAIGDAFGLDPSEREALRIAALLHDIGMTAAGEGVVSASRPLSTVERALLKMHPQIAGEILAQAPALRSVVPIVYHHHEWYDGAGYLGGLAGESIPLGARILAVADAYVAMTSDRPYRLALTQRDALRELSEKAGTQFDPAVVDALKDILRGGSNRVPGSSGAV